jgi:hypothetical protein
MADTAKPKRSRSRIKPIWERGYYSHGYWRGKEKLGTVKLGPRGEWDGIYRWQAGSHAGEASTLDEAKRNVEAAALAGASQMQLFGD